MTDKQTTAKMDIVDRLGALARRLEAGEDVAPESIKLWKEAQKEITRLRIKVG